MSINNNKLKSYGVDIIGPVDANDHVLVNIAAASTVVPISGSVSVVNTPSVTISGTPPVTISNTPTVTQQQSITEFTSLPYSVPGNGRIVFQIAGSGSVATISFNNGSTTYSLNSGSTLANGAIYEFSVAVAAGDVFQVSGATFIRGFFIQGVMA